MAERYLNRKAKQVLIEWLAANGESYNMYLAFCEKMGWKPYTKGSLHSFYNRNRASINVAKMQFAENIKQDTEYVKANRVQLLQDTVDILRRQLNTEVDPAMILKLSDGIRKQLQAIAQELGDWNKEPTRPPEGLGARLLDDFESRLLVSPDVVEGSYDIISDEEP